MNADTKILQLATTDSGGAGIAAWRLNYALRTHGFDSTMLSASKCFTDDHGLVLPQDYTSPGPHTSFHETNYFSDKGQANFKRWAYMIQKLYPNRPKGLELYSDVQSEFRLEQVKEILGADIINFHWVAGITDFATLAPLLRNKTIVWTLHDMNPFTGGCHYAGTCEKYMSQCGACPQLGSDQPNDLSAYNQAVKAKAFEGANIHVVTPSRWLAACAAKSALFSQFPVSVIPNSVPTDVFTPLDKVAVRRELGLPVDKPVVLFGAQSQNNLRKGPDFLIDALRSYRASEDAKDITIVSFGECPEALTTEFGESWVNLGAVYNMYEQAKIYSAADVFVLPSREDNLPNTMLESLACGTPVISFRTGGMPDMVRQGRTGYLADPFEIEGLVQGLRWALHVDHEKALERRAVCRQFALNTFTMTHQAQRYGELYQQVSVSTWQTNTLGTER